MSRPQVLPLVPLTLPGWGACSNSPFPFLFFESAAETFKNTLRMNTNRSRPGQLLWVKNSARTNLLFSALSVESMTAHGFKVALLCLKQSTMYVRLFLLWKYFTFSSFCSITNSMSCLMLCTQMGLAITWVTATILCFFCFFLRVIWIHNCWSPKLALHTQSATTKWAEMLIPNIQFGAARGKQHSALSLLSFPCAG